MAIGFLAIATARAIVLGKFATMQPDTEALTNLLSIFCHPDEVQRSQARTKSSVTHIISDNKMIIVYTSPPLNIPHQL